MGLLGLGVISNLISGIMFSVSCPEKITEQFAKGIQFLQFPFQSDMETDLGSKYT